MTSFSPDQVSSTAQTLTSTRSIDSATARITSSVRSLGTLDAFFGHDAQINPAGASRPRSAGRAGSSIDHGTPDETIRAMLETVARYRGERDSGVHRGYEIT